MAEPVGDNAIEEAPIASWRFLHETLAANKEDEHDGDCDQVELTGIGPVLRASRAQSGTSTSPGTPITRNRESRTANPDFLHASTAYARLANPGAGDPGLPDRAVGPDDGQVALTPDEPRLEPGIAQPCDLVGRRIGKVELGRQRDHRIGRLLGSNDVAENEPAARAQYLRDAAEEIALDGTVEVVHGERCDDKVESGSQSCAESWGAHDLFAPFYLEARG